MPFPFIDLQAQFSHLKPQIQARIDRVLEHGQYIMGPEVTELETELAAFCQVKHVLGCSSGTDALLLALMALDVGPGDAVFTTPFSFVATAEVIALLGAVPVFVDIDPETFAMDAQNLDLAVEAIRKRDPSLYPLPAPVVRDPSAIRPKAVLPVDLFGLPADYDAIGSVTDRYGLDVVEDAAQSFGASYKGRMAGTLGRVGCTSFFPAKPLGGYGDGGAVFTDDTGLYREMHSLRVHGQGEDKYVNRRLGLNARLDTLQAAILLPKLEIFPQELRRRQEVADLYSRELRQADVRTPVLPSGLNSAWAQYSILADGRDDLCQSLASVGIPTNVYYRIPLHVQRAFSSLGYHASDMPVSEQVAERIVSLPMHPYLSDKQVRAIAAMVRERRPLT